MFISFRQSDILQRIEEIDLNKRVSKDPISIEFIFTLFNDEVVAVIRPESFDDKLDLNEVQDIKRAMIRAGFVHTMWQHSYVCEIPQLKDIADPQEAIRISHAAIDFDSISKFLSSKFDLKMESIDEIDTFDSNAIYAVTEISLVTIKMTAKRMNRSADILNRFEKKMDQEQREKILFDKAKSLGLSIGRSNINSVTTYHINDTSNNYNIDYSHPFTLDELSEKIYSILIQENVQADTRAEEDLSKAMQEERVDEII